MPLTAPHRQNGDSSQFSKIGLILLLLAMSIGLGFWLYGSLKKKESARTPESQDQVDTTTPHR